MGESCKRVLPRLHVPILEKVGRVVDIEDKPVPQSVAKGLPLVGESP